MILYDSCDSYDIIRYYTILWDSYDSYDII